MPEQFKQFDFSKEEDQKKFGKLNKDEQKKIARESEYEAYSINDNAKELAKNVIGRSKPEKEDYELAEQMFLQEEFAYSLSVGDMDRALAIKDSLRWPEEEAKRGFVDRLSVGDIDCAMAIKNRFNLSEAVVQGAAQRGLVNLLSVSDSVRDVDCAVSYIDRALAIKDNFSLPEAIISSQEVQEAVEKSFIYLLSRDVIENLALAIKIKDEFNLPEVFAQEVAKQQFFNNFSAGERDAVTEIKDTFNLTILLQEIIQQIPALSDLIEKISQFVPEFQAQVEKSSDLAIGLCQFIKEPDQLINNLKENPFLVDAIANNPRFSSRLFIKYLEFDDESKENIEKQFSSKKKIMSENPELDPESLEFRQMMQEELKEFKNNSEIIEAIKKRGINLDEWLNYSETSYFNLSTGGSEIAFSEKIRTPIDRIKETIDSYAHTIKSVLKEYRPEMEKYEIILEDAKSIEDQIAKMEAALEQAKAEGNDKKTQGIEKGLASQKEKLNNLKKGWLWDKLTGEIAAFQRLKNDCFDAQNRLIEAENKLEQALSGKMPSGKMVQDIKQAITSSKEELRSKFGDLEKRIESFKTELPNLISPCLGQERSEALIQEIDQKVAEQFNHFESDRTTVANLFSERGDKEAGQLESRPMSIFVWARNPDIDLYQGNYSLCCISIETGSGGGSPKSTIADFNTDLGIQIVNIWDEVKNEPVTAAWCWLGKDDEGKTALVVDNIESNTLYSANFSEQLTEELFEYLKNYARKIGVDKVVLGKAHNDLPTASKTNEMEKDKSANVYEKVGGYNRNDGYYLEAQMYGTKIIQESGDKTKEKKKEKVEIAKVEFKDIKIEPVSDKNLAKILQAERKIYASTGLISGQTMVEDMKRGNGFEYSVAMQGVRPGKKQAEIVAYIVAVEDETDEGDKSIYLEDIAVLPEAQRQGIGWEAMKEFIAKLKAKAAKDGQPVLLDMHLRETSQTFMANHHADLEGLGVKLIEEALVPDYYDEGEDSLYQVYEIK